MTPTQRNSLRYVYREEEMTMMTVNEVSKLTGVSIRTLQYYDTIGLLKPIEYTESGYRLYDDTSLERLQQILLFKELEFPLKEIKKIIDAPNFDRNKALEQQIELLTMKKEHLENLISFARGIKGIGVKYMDFKVFDTTKIDEYSKRAKEQWGQTSEYKEFEEKTKNWTKDDEATVANEFMQLFVEFGQMKEMDPEDEQVQLQVRKLQDYITDHFYTCSDKILCGLGRMYAGGGELTENIDDVGGVGTAEFVGSDYRNTKGLDTLKQEISVGTTGGISFIEIYEVYPEVRGEKKRVILFQIPAATTATPTGWNDHFYGRNGESLGALSVEELDRIRGQEKKDWSKQIIPEAKIEYLDKEAIALARENYKKKMNKPYISDEVNQMTDEQFLTKLKLIINGKITNAAMLLLGREDYDYLFNTVPEASWRVFDSRNEISDYEIFKIPYITLSERLFGKIRNLTYRYMPMS